MSFISMCDGTSADWEIIKTSVDERQLAMPRRVLDLLRQLEAQTDGFAVNQLEHSLQTATRALRGGADDELVVAALCHDIGKAISVTNHASIGAAILRPYVGPETYSILLHHQDFQGLYYFEFLGRDPHARDKYVHEPWYETACRFVDDWDQQAFDPAYDTLPLSSFSDLVDRFFVEEAADARR